MSALTSLDTILISSLVMFCSSCAADESSFVLVKIFAIYFNKILNDSTYCQTWDLKSTCE